MLPFFVEWCLSINLTTKIDITCDLVDLDILDIGQATNFKVFGNFKKILEILLGHFAQACVNETDDGLKMTILDSQIYALHSLGV